MNDFPWDAWQTQAIELSQQAGELLLKGWRTGTQIEKKGRIDLVTEYDRRVEDLLTRELRARFPEHQIIGEEAGKQTQTNDWIWWIDPLDGTTNFAHGHFFFCVSLGLAYRGNPMLGVIHAPALRCTWSGGPQLGAHRNGQAITLSKTHRLDESLVATGFPYDRGTSKDNNLAEVHEICPRVRGLRRCGSAALDLALLADGTYDAYWEQKLQPWDVCAGVAIARGAGAYVTNYLGDSFNLLEGKLIASNANIHPPLLAAIKKARGEFSHEIQPK